MGKLKNLLVQMGQIVTNATDDKTIKAAMAIESVKLIVDRTKSGFGVKNEKAVKLKPLKRSTIERRKRSQLAGDTSPSKSNLTETGNMLDSVTYRTNKKGYTIFVKDDNKKVAGVSEDRPFLGLTDKDQDRLAEILDTELLKLLSKLK
jgi:hypothetical protein